MKKASKVNEFKELVERAKAEHVKTPAALVEENLKEEGLENIPEDLTDSVLRGSLERLDDEISERANGIAAKLTENELREFRGILAARLPTVEQQREGGITVEDRIDLTRAEETHWREEAKRQVDPKKKLLYKSIADVAALKADELRLRANIRPESERAQNIVEEEADQRPHETRKIQKVG